MKVYFCTSSPTEIPSSIPSDPTISSKRDERAATSGGVFNIYLLRKVFFFFVFKVKCNLYQALCYKIVLKLKYDTDDDEDNDGDDDAYTSFVIMIVLLAWYAFTLNTLTTKFS